VNSGGPGTPLYMAPEQIDSKTFGPITYATDIYSMGILLYQLFSGHPPFTGTVTELLNAHVNLRPPALHTGTQWSVPRELEEVLNRALAKQPRERFASAQEFRQQLLEISGALTRHPKTMVETPHTETESTRLSAPRIDEAAPAPLETPAPLPVASFRPTPPARNALALVLTTITVMTVVLAAGIAVYLYLIPHGTTPRVEVATGADIATPLEPVDASVPSTTPTTVAVTPVTGPESSSPPVAPDAGMTGNTQTPETTATSPSVQVSDLAGAAPKVSVVDLGYGALDFPTPKVGAPAIMPPSIDLPAGRSEETGPAVSATTQPAGTPEPSPDASATPREYKVKPGDTLLKIAEANKVDAKDLQWWNGLKDPNNLIVEQTLYLYARPDLPSKEKFFASIPKPAPAAPPSAPKAAPAPEPAPTPVQTTPAPPTKQPAKKKNIKEFFHDLFH